MKLIENLRSHIKKNPKNFLKTYIKSNLNYKYNNCDCTQDEWCERRSYPLMAHQHETV